MKDTTSFNTSPLRQLLNKSSVSQVSAIYTLYSVSFVKGTGQNCEKLINKTVFKNLKRQEI